MFALLDLLLLVSGTVLPLVIFSAVWLSRNKTYFAWAKVVSIVGAVAALGWGAVQSMILYHRMMRHTRSQFEADRLALAIISLGCIFTIAGSRAYKATREDAEPT